jgi:hypothetical protein
MPADMAAGATEGVQVGRVEQGAGLPAFIAEHVCILSPPPLA